MVMLFVGTGWDDGIWFWGMNRSATRPLEAPCGPFAGLSVFSVVGEASISSPDFVQPSAFRSEIAKERIHA